MSEQNQKEKQPLIRLVNRQQMSWRAVDVEKLIGEDHPARAIWSVVGQLDLRRFYDAIESSAQEGGRAGGKPLTVGRARVAHTFIGKSAGLDLCPRRVAMPLKRAVRLGAALFAARKGCGSSALWP